MDAERPAETERAMEGDRAAETPRPALRFTREFEDWAVELATTEMAGVVTDTGAPAEALVEMAVAVEMEGGAVADTKDAGRLELPVEISVSKVGTPTEAKMAADAEAEVTASCESIDDSPTEAPVEPKADADGDVGGPIRVSDIGTDVTTEARIGTVTELEESMEEPVEIPEEAVIEAAAEVSGVLNETTDTEAETTADTEADSLLGINGGVGTFNKLPSGEAETPTEVDTRTESDIDEGFSVLKEAAEDDTGMFVEANTGCPDGKEDDFTKVIDDITDTPVERRPEVEEVASGECTSAEMLAETSIADEEL